MRLFSPSVVRTIVRMTPKIPRKIDALAAVRAILGDMPTDGSNYFVDPVLAPNSWAERNRKKSIKIEDHQFFY